METKDISKEVYEKEVFLLEQIQLNSSLRNSVLSVDVNSFPMDGEDFPVILKNKINNSLPIYLKCESKICEVNQSCVLSESNNEDVYARSVIISSNLTTYSPRKLKLFCWIDYSPKITEEEEPETPELTCEEAGGICYENPCEDYDNCEPLTTFCRDEIVETGCVENFNDECNEWDYGVSTGDCGSWFGDTEDEEYACYEEKCYSVDCGVGEYCCNGTCTEPVEPGTAVLSLSFSDVVYELKQNIWIEEVFCTTAYYYYHTRTFTESNGVGGTLTKGQLCRGVEGCGSNVSVNYRIEGNNNFITTNNQFYTTYAPDSFTLKYWGIDDNGYSIYVEQIMSVSGASHTP